MEKSNRVRISDWCKRTFGILLLLYLQQFQLTCGLRVAKRLILMEPGWVLLNMLIVACPYLLLYLITGRRTIAIAVNGILCTLFSLINYHVLVYHGSPFFAQDIHSIKTAVEVAGGYKFLFRLTTLSSLVIFLVEMVLFLWLIKRKIPLHEKKARLAAGIKSAVCICGLYLLFFSPIALFQNNLITWSWEQEVLTYGYGVCFCNSLYSLSHVIIEPEGYQEEMIQEQKAKVEDCTTPDIILILNETLCDISVYADVPESRELFRQMEEIPGVIAGQAISPMVGGGTNDTEFELLTSCSTSLLSMSAPFTTMSMEGIDNVVAWLKEYQYSTTAMHCRLASNYSRNRAYKDLGFDQLILGQENFRYFSTNGNRECLDSDNYKDLLEQYDQAGDNPRMMYLLTFQNHGGYDQNEPEEDSIKTEMDYQAYTQEVNEYLSSIAYSVSAFQELIRTLDAQERPVVVLMVGDHAPSFLSDLPAKEGITDREAEICLRTVPYYIWSNQPLDTSCLSKNASMTDMLPMVLAAANMPRSAFHETVLQLNQTLPVRLKSGICMDNRSQIIELGNDPEYEQLLKNYQYLEYQMLTSQ
ncbi:MAG: LTA synthase family protein [Lachnospiraceae bacterium]|nr:LTA synthase family protein [Lachnospiraceae bacterium]